MVILALVLVTIAQGQDFMPPVTKCVESHLCVVMCARRDVVYPASALQDARLGVDTVPVPRYVL